MTRRLFVVLPVAAIAGTVSSPRNDLCAAANEFHAPYAAWAEKMNAARTSPAVLPAGAVQAFQPLPDLWRRVERCFRAWVRGQ